MGSLRLVLCTGALAVAALAPAAYAADGEGVSVAPAASPPGADVALAVAGCAGRTALAVSPAFVSDVRLTAADGVLAGESRVRSPLTAGTYDVRVDCGGTERRGTLEVTPARRPGGTAGSVVPHAARPAAPAVHTPAADASRAHGPNTAQTVTGLALAGTAVVAVVRDRLRRSGGTD